MNHQDKEIRLDYKNEGIKPTRYKLCSIVYSDQKIETRVEYKLSGFKVKLKPITDQSRLSDRVGNYMSAFECEVISEPRVHQSGGNFDISEVLDRILPWLGFDYRLPISFSEYEEYEGRWVECSGPRIDLSVQVANRVLSNRDIIEKCDRLTTKESKRARKAEQIRLKLQEGIKFQHVSRRCCFLSFYNVIEFVSDDFTKEKVCRSEEPCIVELKQLGVLSKGSQRMKIYSLLKSIDNEFDLSKSIKLADLRNKLAHSEESISSDEEQLCREIAFWAAKRFVLIVTEEFE